MKLLIKKSNKPNKMNRNRYRIYHHEQEIDLCEQQIELIEKYVSRIKRALESKDESFQITGCCQYEACERRVCEPSEKKLCEYRSELLATELYINNKYECKIEIIDNEFEELKERAKQRLIAKYTDKKLKQERLFRNEFGRHQKKKEKHQKKKGSPPPTPTSLEDVLFKKDRYQRAKILSSSSSSTTPSLFNNPEMQQKWSSVEGIADRDMEHDVNTMVADQDKGLEIKDILSSFPRYDVSYKSDKNVLKINGSTDIKVGSYIATKYKGQSIMLGVVKSINNKEIYVWSRQKGDKFGTYSLNKILITNIEEGKVKIKFIH